MPRQPMSQIPTELLTKIINTLAERPYKEVYQLLAEIFKSTVNLNIEEPPKQIDQNGN